MTNTDIKNIAILYESHFYDDMSDDQKDQYYSHIKGEIKPFVSECNQLAIAIQEISYKIEELTYSEEYKKLKELIENYTENPEQEERDIITFIIDRKKDLDRCTHELTADNVSEFLTDILTGNKLQ
jgi:hypothetical protein